MISFTRGVPPIESFPTGRIIQCADHVLSESGGKILQYGKAGGYDPLRLQLAEQYKTERSHILIGQGSLQLLDLLCKVTILKKELSVFIEQPTYDRSLKIFQRTGAKLIGFPLNNGSIELDAVKKRLEQGHVPAYFYLIPDFQNPSGAVMKESVRRELIELARRFGFFLIEDGPYRHLRYLGEDQPMLYDLAPDCVIHMSSFSKLISPGIRVGYMILPESLCQKVTQYAEDSYISPSYLNQAIVSDFIRRGWVPEQIQTLRMMYRPRLEAILSAMQNHLSEFGEWITPSGGFFVGFTCDILNNPFDQEAVRSEGLKLTDGSAFFLEGGFNFIRLPFCALEPQHIQQGIACLAKFIHSLS